MPTIQVPHERIADPKTHYGHAHASTRHFITQRVTGAINIVFLALLLFIVLRLAGTDRSEMVETLGAWYLGLPLAVLLVIVTIHMRNGMRDVLEDYFAGGQYRLTMTLNTVFTLLVAVAGVAALVKLVFWG